MLYTGKRIIRDDLEINRIAIDNYTAALLLAVFIFTFGCYFAEGYLIFRHFFSRFHEIENNRLKNIACSLFFFSFRRINSSYKMVYMLKYD